MHLVVVECVTNFTVIRIIYFLLLQSDLALFAATSEIIRTIEHWKIKL